MVMSAESRHRLAITLAAFCLLISKAVSAAPVTSGAQEGRLAACIREAAAGRGWLEKTLWGLRDKEAGWIGAEIPNTNGSHDLGPLQINSSWVPKLAKLVGRPPKQVRFWLTHDPCFNVQAARWIFLAGLSATGDYWNAIGVYHSPTKWRQQEYATGVATKLRRRFGTSVFD
jgi:hypothetical protein